MTIQVYYLHMAMLEKKNLANCLESFEDLIEYISSWKDINSEFRIDGVKGISPANPSQWIFFKIENFKKSAYKGEDTLGNQCDGTDWNGIYYLAGGTRSKALSHLLKKCNELNGDPNKIFELSYTNGKEGNPNKRRIELKDFDGSGWNCLKYRSQNW